MRTRDVRFINGVTPSGKPAVYRNEDTRWSFPWYFKFNSGNLQAIAQDLASNQDEPQWVVIKHYGWRFEIMDAFPNVVEMDPVEGPDVTVIPWLSIFLVVLIIVAGYYAWVLWRNFLERLALDERFDNASTSLAQVWRWLRANVVDFRSRRDNR